MRGRGVCVWRRCVCVDGVCEADVQAVVVLQQRGASVVQHQLLQAAEQIKGFRETKATRGTDDHTVLHLPPNPENTHNTEHTHRTCQRTGEEVF